MALQTHLMTDISQLQGVDAMFMANIAALEDENPKLWKALPTMVREKLEDLNADGLADLLEQNPEMFHQDAALQRLENLAWEHLMERRGLLPNGQPDHS